MGEVNQLDDSVNQGVAERDQRVEETVSESKEGHLGKLLRRFDEISCDPDDRNKS